MQEKAKREIDGVAEYEMIRLKSTKGDVLFALGAHAEHDWFQYTKQAIFSLLAISVLNDFM